MLSFGDDRAVAQKTIFYVLRPAAALRWLRLHPGEAIAPMNFPQLMTACELPADVRAISADLLARKAATREMGDAPLPRELAIFIETEFDHARAAFDTGPVRIADAARAAAETFFRDWVRRLDPAPSVPTDP